MILLLSSGASLRAETLLAVLTETYSRNPVLNAARHGIDATEHSVERAAAGLNLRIDAFGDAGVAWDRDLPSSTEARLPASIGLAATLPLYDGGKTRYSTRAAESRVSSGREALAARVQAVLLETVMAYATIVQQEATVVGRRHHVELFEAQLGQSLAGLAAGQTTPVEISTIEARQTRAKAALRAAEAALRTAKADFKRVVGRPSGQLEEPTLPEHALPRSIELLLASLEDRHPAILAAEAELAAAEAEIRVARSDLLPRINLDGELKHQSDPDNDTEQQTVASVVARVTVPLLESGEVRSRIAEAVEIREQRRLDLDAVRAQVEQQVVAAWAALAASRGEVEAAARQVSSATLARDTVAAEVVLGQATPVEQLDAEDALVEAAIVRLSARRNEVIAFYGVLAAAGQLDGILSGESRESAAFRSGKQRVTGGSDLLGPWQTTVSRPSRGSGRLDDVTSTARRQDFGRASLRSTLQ
jgi:outer membrane protein